MKILIVDDEPHVRSAMSRVIRLHDEKFDVKEAEDGREAVELLAQQPVDLVISDIRMPEMDGLELSRYMRCQYPETFMILLTGHADFEYAQQAIRVSVFDYLLKPASRESILERVDTVGRLLAERIRNEKPYPIHSQGLLEKRVTLPRLVRQTFDYIEAHYAADITLASLAERLEVNPNYLSGLLKVKTGHTFTHHVTRFRLAKSKQLLATTNLKIYQICEQVGYVDQAYFSRLFKSTVGMTPIEYREANFIHKI